MKSNELEIGSLYQLNPEGLIGLYLGEEQEHRKVFNRLGTRIYKKFLINGNIEYFFSHGLKGKKIS